MTMRAEDSHPRWYNMNDTDTIYVYLYFVNVLLFVCVTENSDNLLDLFDVVGVGMWMWIKISDR